MSHFDAAMKKFESRSVLQKQRFQTLLDKFNKLNPPKTGLS